MRDFSEKVAVVTGGASGVGRAIAAKLAGDGAKVVIADVDAESIAKTRDELASEGLTVDGMEVDVTRPESVDALAERVFATYGNVHLLFNNAGVGVKEAKRRIWTIPEKDWQWTYSVNVVGVTNGIRAFVPTMLEHGEEGHVINTSSGNGGIASLPTTPVHASSKAAASAGVEFKLTEPEEVADMAIEGVRDGRFWILSKLGKNDERLRTRTVSILGRENPEPTQ